MKQLAWVSSIWHSHVKPTADALHRHLKAWQALRSSSLKERLSSRLQRDIMQRHRSDITSALAAGLPYTSALTETWN